MPFADQSAPEAADAELANLDLILAGEVLASTPGGRCTVTRILRAMPPVHAEWFVDQLSNSVSASVIARTLQTAGYDIAKSSIERHRRRDCKCLTL